MAPAGLAKVARMRRSPRAVTANLARGAFRVSRSLSETRCFVS
ncbi:hypothetical protein AKJ09_08068 [Labilithrix luteola]|uniref:Uncharacterized protein n=1 Tax=Labilithrix luteola TaxID=1391654 RepID=A0A0K1Q7L8_9BACT|nr:hypothetical protein AKJ09_08068 [Labilithrix luteola]